MTSEDALGNKLAKKKSKGGAGMGNLEADGVRMLASGKRSEEPALDVTRWGDKLCGVTIEDTSGELQKNQDADIWNLSMTEKTLCLYHDDGENCKLIPRRNIQMVDLVDTDEYVVKVRQAPAWTGTALN